MTSIQTDLFTVKKLKPQHVQILKYMQTHSGVTVDECRTYCACTELRSRIAELRHPNQKYGYHNIIDKPERTETGKSIKRYFLIEK